MCMAVGTTHVKIRVKCTSNHNPKSNMFLFVTFIKTPNVYACMLWLPLEPFATLEAKSECVCTHWQFDYCETI